MSISVYSPFSGSTYIKLPWELKNAMKGLINIKNKDSKCFLWCHLNPLKTHPERIIKADKKMVYGIDYEGLTFPVSIKVFSKIERKNKVCINVFCYENKLNYSVYISD